MKRFSSESLQNQMVEQQLVPRGISDPAVLNAMRLVPRHLFVPEHLISHAYEDGPLPIGEGQTISQPYIVALMAESAELKPTDRVLEIGTGSGYSAAVLSLCASKVFTVERLPNLIHHAIQVLKNLNYNNIETHIANGSLGWVEKHPFDAIVVTAGAPVVPQALKDQLAIGGRLIIPVGDSFSQKLLRVRKINENEFWEEELEAVRFVPLIGEEGWQAKD